MADQNNAATPYTVADLPTIGNTDWSTVIPSIYMQLFGRAPVQWEIDKLVEDFGKNKNPSEAAIRAGLQRTPEHALYLSSQQPKRVEDQRVYLNSPEYIASLLGPSRSGSWQDQARAANFGTNAMNGVFSDYANPNMATGQLGDPYSQGNLMINSILGLIDQQVNPVTLEGLMGNLASGKSNGKSSDNASRLTPNPEGATFFERLGRA